MGVPVMVMGASGSGKSTSLRNFDPDEIGIFNVASKPMPFRKSMKVINHASYGAIMKVLQNASLKKYAIDDSQYLMAFESFDKMRDKGFEKFTAMASNFYSLLRWVVEKTPDDCIVYFLHHTEVTDDGRIKAKTLGKVIDNNLTLEGMFSIVLLCQIEGNEHFFITNSDGSNTAKSPMDMFEMKIPNDLKFVDTTIREYYGMKGGQDEKQRN